MACDPIESFAEVVIKDGHVVGPCHQLPILHHPPTSDTGKGLLFDAVHKSIKVALRSQVQPVFYHQVIIISTCGVRFQSEDACHKDKGTI